ncbi:MAG: helix-turn-helix domain-containing protein [Oliverpabstia sp.]
MEYDKEHNSELLESLYYYLYLGHSHNECANRMHIHKSTFLYRLNTIKEILSIDFSDPEECLSILISARIALKFKAESERKCQNTDTNGNS